MSATYANALTALTPNAKWSMTNDADYNTISWYSTDIAKPTQAACDAEIAALNANAANAACQQQASALLYATDWASIPDVASSTNNPYLTNQADFIAYRNIVRGYAVNPVANPVFPTQPVAKWSA
jgi:hypothetical protein